MVKFHQELVEPCTQHASDHRGNNGHPPPTVSSPAHIKTLSNRKLNKQIVFTYWSQTIFFFFIFGDTRPLSQCRLCSIWLAKTYEPGIAHLRRCYLRQEANMCHGTIPRQEILTCGTLFSHTAGLKAVVAVWQVPTTYSEVHKYGDIYTILIFWGFKCAADF